MKKPSRFRKLIPAQKKEVWAPSKENAGAGWEAKGSGEPPRRFILNRERDSEPLLTEIFKKEMLKLAINRERRSEMEQDDMKKLTELLFKVIFEQNEVRNDEKNDSVAQAFAIHQLAKVIHEILLKRS